MNERLTAERRRWADVLRIVGFDRE